MKRTAWLIVLAASLTTLLAMAPACHGNSRSVQPSEPYNLPETQLPEGKVQKLVIEDDFSEAGSGWFATPENDKGGNYEDGTYVLWVEKTGSKVASLVTLDEIYDFILEIDATKLIGEKGSYFFIIYRLDENMNMYAVGVSDELEYSIVKYELGRATAMLKNWTKSKYIKGGNKTNSLKIVCIGRQTDVYINGYKVASVIDDTSLKGQIGIGIKSFSETGARYSFDNFRLWIIE